MICDDDSPGPGDYSHDVWPPDQGREKVSILISFGFPQEVCTEAASHLHRSFRGSGERKRVGLLNLHFGSRLLVLHVAARLYIDNGLV
jgi:hypothetical protein